MARDEIKSTGKGAVHILGKICLMSDPDIAHMEYSNEVQAPYAPIFDGRLLLGMSLFSKKYSMLSPHRETC